MHIISKILIACTSKFRGEDSFGNKYYERIRKKNHLRSKRFVLFKGTAEASNFPQIGMGVFTTHKMKFLQKTDFKNTIGSMLTFLI